jgi:hypothetical protein
MKWKASLLCSSPHIADYFCYPTLFLPNPGVPPPGGDNTVKLAPIPLSTFTLPLDRRKLLLWTTPVLLSGDPREHPLPSRWTTPVLLSGDPRQHTLPSRWITPVLLSGDPRERPLTLWDRVTRGLVLQLRLDPLPTSLWQCFTCTPLTLSRAAQVLVLWLRSNPLPPFWWPCFTCTPSTVRILGRFLLGLGARFTTRAAWSRSNPITMCLSSCQSGSVAEYSSHESSSAL